MSTDLPPRITVAQALALPPVQRGLPLVVAGERNLDRPIRWVHAGEVSYIASVLLGGELLLTTGMGIGRRAADQRRFVHELDEAGAAALFVELGGALDDLPRARARGRAARAAARRLPPRRPLHPGHGGDPHRARQRPLRRPAALRRDPRPADAGRARRRRHPRGAARAGADVRDAGRAGGRQRPRARARGAGRRRGPGRGGARRVGNARARRRQRQTRAARRRRRQPLAGRPLRPGPARSRRARPARAAAGLRPARRAGAPCARPRRRPRRAVAAAQPAGGGAGRARARQLPAGARRAAG